MIKSHRRDSKFGFGEKNVFLLFVGSKQTRMDWSGGEKRLISGDHVELVIFKEGPGELELSSWSIKLARA